MERTDDTAGQFTGRVPSDLLRRVRGTLRSRSAATTCRVVVDPSDLLALPALLLPLLLMKHRAERPRYGAAALRPSTGPV